MGRPRAEEQRNTREEILSAALAEFSAHGYHATSMRTLASAVGVRESALYHHFSSKEALLRAIVEDIRQSREALHDEETQSASAADAGPPTPIAQKALDEILTDLTMSIIELVAEPRQRQLLRVVMSAGPELFGDDSSPWRVLTEPGRRQLSQIFQKLRRAGRVREDLEFEIFLAHLVAPTLMATNAMWAEGKGALSLPLRRFVREHVAFLVRAIAAPRTRSRVHRSDEV